MATPEDRYRSLVETLLGDPDVSRSARLWLLATPCGQAGTRLPTLGYPPGSGAHVRGGRGVQARPPTPGRFLISP